MFPLLRKPNSLGRTLTWNLPAGKTCPAAGDCRNYCYAQAGCFAFSNVKANHLANLKLTKQHAFLETAINWLARRNKKPACVRFHSSGDVYSQVYLNKLTVIAKFHPDIKFYLYTKSLHFDWSKFDELPNTTRIISLGGKYDRKAWRDPQHYNKPVCVVAKDQNHYNFLTSNGYIDGTNDDGIAAAGDTPCIVLRKH